ncbi:hypothetical protein H0H81_001757 [Sphagnurus paluster]|uniref:Uncharacterized protein n=1 Tax=Sphagnurus paluster TaxID=117069 RepID=A0A9P7KN51_9AGAR|nr:hypothetical protein H0H81_001757 [Sphagnurus paluster]
MVRLHVDHSPGDPNAHIPARVSDADSMASRYQKRIAEVANGGSSERESRELIAELTSFCSTVRHDEYPDLKASFRLFKYLFEVRFRARSQSGDYEQTINKLKEEKAELEQKVEAALSAHKDDRESALVIEMSLREHCARAHKAYEDMYNFVVAEWMKLCERMSHIRSAELRSFNQSRSRGSAATTPELWDADADLSAYHAEQMRPSGAAVTDSSTFLVSPLPQFTGTFQGTFALPESESEAESRDVFDEPRTASPVPHSPERTRSIRSGAHPTTSLSRGGSIGEPIAAAAPGRSAPIPIPAPQREAAHGSDKYGQETRRTSSHSNPPQSRTRSSGEISPNPIPVPSPSTRAPSGPARNEDTTRSSPIPVPAPSQQTYKNPILQELLTDTPSSTSSPLPVTTRSPASTRRDSRDSHNSHENRTTPTYVPMHHTLTPQDREYHPAAISSSTSPPHNGFYSDKERQPATTASAVAKAMHEKAKAEKAERERIERERQRERDHEREERPPTRPSRDSAEHYTETSDRHRRQGTPYESVSSSSQQSRHQWPDATDRSQHVSSSSASRQYATHSHDTADRSHHPVSSSTSRHHSSSRDVAPKPVSSSHTSTYGGAHRSSSGQTNRSSGGSIKGSYSGGGHSSTVPALLSATKA